MDKGSASSLLFCALLFIPAAAAAQGAEPLSDVEVNQLAELLATESTTTHGDSVGAGGGLPLNTELAVAAGIEAGIVAFTASTNVLGDRDVVSYAEAQAEKLYRSMQDAFFGSMLTSDACVRKSFRNYGVSERGKNACYGWCIRTRYPLQTCSDTCVKKLDQLCYDNVG